MLGGEFADHENDDDQDTIKQALLEVCSCETGCLAAGALLESLVIDHVDVTKREYTRLKAF